MLFAKIAGNPRSLVFAVIVVLLLNPWTAAWMTGRTHGELANVTAQNIFIFDAAILLCGLALYFWDITRCVFAYIARNPWLQPRVPRAVVYSAIPLGILATGIVCAGLWKEQLPLLHPASLLLLLDHAASMTLVMAALYLIFIKLFRRPLLALAALTPYAGLIVFEAVSTPLFGMRFDPALLGTVDTNSLRGLLMPTVLLLAGAATALLLWAACGLRRLPHASSWLTVWQVCLALALVLVCRFGYLGYRVATAPVPARFKNHADSIWTSDYRNEPLTNALATIWDAKSTRLVQSLNAKESALAEQLGLGLNATTPDYKSPLLAKAARRVIMVFSESLSLDFLGKYNKKYPESLTPFIDSMPGAFHELLACSFPTDPGLATHFCSHPNYQALFKFRYPNSIVRMLNKDGWKTVFIQSSNLAFNKGRQRLSQLGFSEMYGAEWQARQGKGAFISGWGACDRITFDSAVDYIKRYRDERLFIVLLTTDTHFPHGREDYATLEYPEPPAWVHGHSQARLLRAVFRQDHDIKLLYKRLDSEGLLGDESLFILTADHAFPDLPALDEIPGMSRGALRKIPMVIVAGQPLPEAWCLDQNVSQTATAPTLAHLLGVSSSKGWFGRSLYTGEQHKSPSFVWSMSDAASKPYPKEVKNLFRTVLISD